MVDCPICFNKEKHQLKSDYDKVFFGLLGSGNIVSFSGENNKDLLVTVLSRGIDLYSTANMQDEEFNKKPISVCDNTPSGLVAAYPYYNAKEDSDYLIVSDRMGFLHQYKKSGEYPNINFELISVLKDYKNNCVFNIPFDNPAVKIDDLGGYRDSAFDNYLYPIAYPNSDKSIDFIVGDWAGNLWWIPEDNQGYTGNCYKKSLDDVKTITSKSLIEKYGLNYTKPSEKICDENGIPFSLGEGIESGVVFKGANTRPVLYKNTFDKTTDLIVLSGINKKEAFYLKRVGEGNKPTFKNLGEIELIGSDKLPVDMDMHSKIIVKENTDGYHDILISSDHYICIFKNTMRKGPKPVFKFERWIKADNVLTSGNIFSTVIEKFKTGKRYIIDNRWNGSTLDAREIIKRENTVRLSSERIKILDQDGVFTVDGETDPNGGKDFGTIRSTIWDFDSKGKQNLIVGTDKGLLFLLLEDEDSDDIFKYTKIGPLKDTNSDIIKIHNRACPAGIDLTNNGFEDVLVGGAPYQMGCKTDHSPYGGIYYLLNKGLDKEGIPILEPAKRLKIKGFDFQIPINENVTVNTGDIDNDGEKEVYLFTYGNDNMTFYKTLKKEIGIEFMGCHLPKNQYGSGLTLFDIDGDGELELVRAGGEKEMGFYYNKTLIDC